MSFFYYVLSIDVNVLTKIAFRYGVPVGGVDYFPLTIPAGIVNISIPLPANITGIGAGTADGLIMANQDFYNQLNSINGGSNGSNKVYIELKCASVLSTSTTFSVNIPNGTTSLVFWKSYQTGPLDTLLPNNYVTINSLDLSAYQYTASPTFTSDLAMFTDNTNLIKIGLPRNIQTTSTVTISNGETITNTDTITTVIRDALATVPNLSTLIIPSDILALNSNLLNPQATNLSTFQNLTAVIASAPLGLGQNSLRGLNLTKESIINLRDIGNNTFADLMFSGLTYLQIYNAITCFGENTKIMCCVVGTSKIHNLANNERYEERLYVCKKEKYPEVTEDLIITGCHSILVDNITEEQRANLMRVMKDIYVTDSKYRLIASLDERAEPYACEGIFNIYHFALENDSYYKNYGVFANGLLVESCSKRYLKELSNMTILE